MKKVIDYNFLKKATYKMGMPQVFLQCLQKNLNVYLCSSKEVYSKIVQNDYMTFETSNHEPDVKKSMVK